MTWYIIRHAEKAQGDFYNPNLRHQDQPLSAAGQHSAKSLISRFAGLSIATIYVSAYLRTRQTIAPIAKHLHISPIVDARLNEIDNGELDDMTEEEVKLAYPDFWEAYMARNTDIRFPGGETGMEVDARIREFFAEKQAQHPGTNILIVGHEGWIRQMMCRVLELPVYRRGDFKIDFCGLTEIRYQEDYDRWQLIRFNQTIL